MQARAATRLAPRAAAAAGKSWQTGRRFAQSSANRLLGPFAQRKLLGLCRPGMFVDSRHTARPVDFEPCLTEGELKRSDHQPVNGKFKPNPRVVLADDFKRYPVTYIDQFLKFDPELRNRGSAWLRAITSKAQSTACMPCTTGCPACVRLAWIASR